MWGSKLKRYLIPIVLVIFVLASVASVSCGQNTSSTVTAPAQPPVQRVNNAALRDYFNKVQPLVEAHTVTVTTSYNAAETLRLFYSQPPPKIEGVQRITADAIAAQLKAQGAAQATVNGGINKIDSALQKVASEMVDFSVISPPIEAVDYYTLVGNYFLKDRAALSDWLYFYSTLRDRNYIDYEVLARADTHYKEARELQLQADQEYTKIQLKMQ